MAKSQQEPDSDLQKYLDEIAAYEREFKRWEGRVEKILKRYRDEQRETRDTDAKFNILWSNVQTLVPATFSKLPQPDVSRRFRDNDPVGRVASLILERALDFEIQHYVDYRTTMKQSVHDRFLGGRGTSWIRYEPHFKAIEGEPDDGPQITEDVDESPVNEQLDYECAPIDYVHWKDFGHSVARTWEEVNCVWRKVYMNEDAVEERFGEEIAAKIPYDSSPEDVKRSTREMTVPKKQACIIELWDKSEGCAYWISKSMKRVLDEREDPLGLQDFFPCPQPLYATITNETLVPVPDYALYQDQAKELDILADRIDGLTKMLQLKGTYDASQEHLKRLFTEGENGTLIPVKNWAAFAEKSGLKGSVDIYDLTPIAEALRAAQETMEQVKNQVYEITGISDIIRGQTMASETATAQEIKGQYASLRLRAMQDDVARYATSILQLKAQIMCQKFSPQTIMSLAAVDQLTPADQQMIQPAMQLLVGQQRMQDPSADAPNPLRSFRIEVNADTLVQLDEEAEKTNRMEMLTAFSGYLKNAAEVGAQAPQLIPLVVEVAKFGLTAFKIGKAIEGTFDTALDALKQQAMQPQQPPPDPEMVKVQAQTQMEQQRMQFEQQNAGAQLQASQQAEAAKAQREAAAEQLIHQREIQQMQFKFDAEQMRAGLEQETEMKKAALQVAGQIEVAKINAGVKAQQMAVDAQTAAQQPAEEPKEGIDAEEIMQQLLQTHEKLIAAVTAPKRIVRGPDGKASGIETVQ